MTPVSITETAVLAIQSYIKANIPGALADVRTATDSKVNTELPKEYFIAPKQHAFRCPAIFTIAEEVNFNNDKGPNYIDATLDITVSVVVEDKDSQLLTRKGWRYQDALFKLLNQTQIENEQGDIVKFKLISIVKSIVFSEDFSIHDESDARAEFNKEVALKLTVELKQQP